MIKITKGLAKKMYDNGDEIMIIPCRVRTDGLLASWIRKDPANSISFDQVCNAIHYYNCSPETGMTLHYYAKEV